MAYNTIFLKKFVDNYDEKVAAATITPGMLLERTSLDKVQAHSTAGGAAVRMFAKEDALQGGGIDDDYSAATRVQFGICVPGEQVYALLADGETATIGEFLISNGDGYLRCRDAASSGEEPNSIIGSALEALDLSGSSGAETTQRIRIEVA